MSHTEDEDLSRKKRKVKQKVARHAAERARIAADQQDSGPSKTHAPDSIAHEDTPREPILAQPSLSQLYQDQHAMQAENLGMLQVTSSGQCATYEDPGAGVIQVGAKLPSTDPVRDKDSAVSNTTSCNRKCAHLNYPLTLVGQSIIDSAINIRKNAKSRLAASGAQGAQDVTVQTWPAWAFVNRPGV